MVSTLIGTVMASKGEYYLTDAEGHLRSGRVTFRRDCHEGVLPLLLDHHPIQLGEVWYVERQRSGALVAVAELAENSFVDMTGQYLSVAFSARSRNRFAPSATISSVDQDNARLIEVSVVDTTAASGTGPVVIVGHDVRLTRGGYPLGISSMYRQVLDRAADYGRVHHRQRNVVIQDAPPLKPAAPTNGLGPIVRTPTPLRAEQHTPRLDHVRATLNPVPAAVPVPPELQRIVAGQRTHVRHNVGQIVAVGGRPVHRR